MRGGSPTCDHMEEINTLRYCKTNGGGEQDI